MIEYYIVKLITDYDKELNKLKFKDYPTHCTHYPVYFMSTLHTWQLFVWERFGRSSKVCDLPAIVSSHTDDVAVIIGESDVGHMGRVTGVSLVRSLQRWRCMIRQVYLLNNTRLWWTQLIRTTHHNNNRCVFGSRWRGKEIITENYAAPGWNSLKIKGSYNITQLRKW